MTVAFRWLATTFAAFALGSVASGQQTEPTPSPTPATFDVSANPAAPHEPKTIWSQVHVKEPYIAMTLDDGPSATLTPHLLDVLKEKGMHVTFFVVGENAKAHPEILRRAVAEGHEIGNHSWDHPNFAKMSDEAVKSQLNRTKEAIVSAINKPVTLMRPPYGSVTKEQKRWIHDDLGYTIILWDVDPDDWKKPGPEVVERRILEQTHTGSIILSHDIHAGTIQALPDTFDKLLAKGFKFVTVSELIAMDQPELVKHTTTKAGAKDRAPGSPSKSTVPSNLPDKINGSPGQ